MTARSLRSTHLLTPTLLAAAVAVASISGCSTFGGGNDGPRYEASRQAQTLDMPPELAAPGMDPAFQIPDAGDRISARALDREVPRAAAGPRAILPESPEVQLRRDGQTRWLSVAASPEALWPRLREFWGQQNLSLDRDEPAVGIMETAWAEDRAGIPLGTIRGLLSRSLGSIYDAGTRDRYRLRVERMDDAVDIFITHRGAVEEGGRDGEGARWVMRDADPELEAEMLNRLLVFLTTGEVTETAARAPEADFERTGRVDLTEREGRPVLVVWGEPDALWRRLQVALDRSGLHVDTADRGTGLLDVTYRPASAHDTERPGWLRRMFGAGRGASAREDQRYQIRMIENGRDLQIEALSISGEPLRDRDARFVLELIQPQLR